MANVPETTLASLTEIATALGGEHFGAIAVETVDIRIDLDSEDEWAVFLDITLSDPNGATWPYDDVLHLRRRVLDLAHEHPVDATVYVSLSPHTDSPQDDDEQHLLAL